MADYFEGMEKRFDEFWNDDNKNSKKETLNFIRFEVQRAVNETLKMSNSYDLWDAIIRKYFELEG